MRSFYVAMAVPQKQSIALPKVNKRAQYYFICGDDEAAIESFKSAVVEAHLSREEREENYREIIPTSQAGLRRVLGDVMSELSTVSFLPDTKRVVALYPVPDFFQAKTGGKGRATKASKAQAEQPKRSSCEHLVDFIANEMPGLPAILVLIAVEDYEKFKRVVPSNPLVALAQQQGTFVQFKLAGVQFAFFDALFARNAGEAIRLWREWLERTGMSPKPYYQLAAQMRLLIQAKTANSGQLQQRGISRDQYRDELMPSEPDRNFFSLRPEFRQQKLSRAASNFSFGELLGAYEKLEPLLKYAIPVATDEYVPDKSLLAEIWIAEFAAPVRR